MSNQLQKIVESAAGIGPDGQSKMSCTEIQALLDSRRFDSNVPPPPITPIYSLNGTVIATRGNLITITADVKSGKTAVIGAMVASTMTEDKKADCLGSTASNPAGLAVLHFDTEQSREDHWRQAHRMLERAGLSKAPSWFHSYCLTGVDYVKAWECILEAIRQAVKQHKGIHSIFLDGVADLVPDVNDSTFCNRFVADLHALAIDQNCPIVVAIHFNPRSDRVRGHLGSQLERKAETNLRLDKKDEITTIWSDKQRRAPIPKNTGPCFQWSDEAEMHVSVQTRQASKEEAELQELTELAQEMFGERPSMRYSELQTTVKTRLTVSLKTAERKVTRMRQLGVIKKSVAGLYTLTP